MSDPIFSVNPEIMCGALCIHGTRIPVSAIQSFVEDGFSVEEIRREYPTLTQEQIVSVFRWVGVPVHLTPTPASPRPSQPPSAQQTHD